MRLVVASVCLACGVAAAAPPDSPAPVLVKDKYKAAQKLAADDDNEAALALVDQGLALAPKDLPLLQLRGTLLLKTRDYAGALVAYQAYLDAGAQGANKREAIKIMSSLRPVKTTFVDLSANTAATIYLDTKSAGAFCTTPCKKALLPGDYKVIAERAGFERWTGRLSATANQTTALAITLAEKPSALALRVSPAGAAIAIDGKPAEAAIPAGTHQLVATLAGHATAKLEIAAHEGKPIDLEVALIPLIPITVTSSKQGGASLFLDDKPAILEAGGIAVPPGAHTLVAKHPGFHDRTIAIPAEHPDKLAVELVELGTLVDVTGAPAGARILVDGKPVATAPLAQPFEVAPGSHVVEIRLTGYRPYRAVDIFVPEKRARLHLGKLRRDDRRRTKMAAAATGVALVGGSVFSVLALHKQGQFDDRASLAGVTPDDPTLRSLKSAGQRYSIVADVGFSLAIVGIGLTTYLFTHEGRGESEGSLRIGVAVTPNAAGAVASKRF